SFLAMRRPSPTSPLFPYTTLFRSHRFGLIRPALAILRPVCGVDVARHPAAGFGLGSRRHVTATDVDRNQRIGQRFLVPAATLALERADIDAVFGRHNPDGGAMRRRLGVAPRLDINLVALDDFPD